MSSDRLSKRQACPAPPPKGGVAFLWSQMRFPKGWGSCPQDLSPQGAEKSWAGAGRLGAPPRRGGARRLPRGPVGEHSSRQGAMEAPAELLAALPALATALALLLAWLFVRRAQAASSDPAGAYPEPAPQAEASGTSALRNPGAPEPAAAPEEQGEPARPEGAEEQATEAKQDQEQEQEQEQDQDPAEPEEEEGGEAFSFQYSPGKLRGNQYKKMMTKEELEEEQRVQKEQLAAIFKLMKDNKETFGEMSDGDVKEQLRLYDM